MVTVLHAPVTIGEREPRPVLQVDNRVLVSYWLTARKKGLTVIPKQYLLFVVSAFALTGFFLVSMVIGLVRDNFFLAWSTSLVGALGCGGLALTGVLSWLQLKRGR